ncbi:TonB-dependent receptor domain-containing protein [Brevundimonas sp. NPDC092305]|uniref:TonB-dependent receptor n=1 Tax=Brevundimonas sp. NPDC092305 TaxID=3363957 RepID=UPI00381FFE64
MKIQTIRQRLLHSTIIGGAALMALTAVPALTLLAMPTIASAQDYTSGVLSGAVADADGAPVAGASVTVTSGQGTVRSATTDANGSFRMPALPVGAYEIKIEQSGFSTIVQRASVAPGGASYAFTLTAGSDDASTLEDVVVTAARRVQDFNATDTGLSVDVQDFAGRVPVARSINAVTLFAPGASAPDASIAASSRRNQSLVSLSGTSAAESVYYINGLNVTDQRSFLGYGELPFDFIQNIETKTGGYQAEYGRGTGGIVNIVTRSGTNEWTGGFSAFYTPDKLRANRGTTYSPGGSNSAGSENYNSFAKSELVDYTAYLGGPIWRDHLFFFGVYNVRDQTSEGPIARNFPRSASTGVVTGASTMSQVISSYDDPRWAVKLDFVFNPDHRIEATYINDESTTLSQTRTISAVSGAQTAITEPLHAEAGGITQIYKYTGVFTDWFTLSALYGKLENSYLDYGSPVSLPGIYDQARPGGANWLTSGRHTALLNLAGNDTRETTRVDADFYASFFGEHHIRVGWDKEDLTTTADSAFSGGARYTAYGQADCQEIYDEISPGTTAAATGCVNVLRLANVGTFRAEQTALYIQDSWDVTPDLSFQIGLRNDKYDYMNVDGGSYVTIEDQWAPRLGFNWDPFGNNVDRVYGSLGDYYLPIATNTSIRASSGEDFTDNYFVAERDAAGNLILDGIRPRLGARQVQQFLSPPGAPAPEQIAEQDLKPMYEREMILGYEHQFEEGVFADWRVGARYVHRKLESAIEDTQIGDAVARYCVRTGNTTCVTAAGRTPADGAAFSSLFNYVLINPGDGVRVLVDLQADPRSLNGVANPAFNPVMLDLTAEDLNLPEVNRKYQAMEFTFERPFDGVWGLQGSYTLGESKGNYEGAVKSDIGQTDTSLTQDYDHSANMLGAYGYLPNHHRHTLKAFGSWAPVEGVSLGLSFTAQSGRYFGCIGRVPLSVDPYAPQAGTASGWYCPVGPGGSVVQTPRGSMGKTDWTYQTDLNFNLDLIDSPTKGKLTASVNIQNLFDGDAVTRVVEQGIVPVQNVLSPYYGSPRTYQAPRTIRLGLRYNF